MHACGIQLTLFSEAYIQGKCSHLHLTIKNFLTILPTGQPYQENSSLRIFPGDFRMFQVDN